MKVFAGCSGFYYKDWTGKFYPDDLPVKDWLSYYAERFNTVEINSSFYHLPSERTVKGWYDRTPDDFVFTLKGSRYITHIRKLKDVAEEILTFYRRAEILSNKLGTILWQLPGNFHVNDERLEGFCRKLSPAFSNVIEFRHTSWFNERVYDMLRQFHVSVCTLSAPGDLPETLKTAELVYVRFHGKQAWYNYLYREEELAAWHDRIIAAQPSNVFAYFNNDYNANAVVNCLAFAKMFEKVTF